MAAQNGEASVVVGESTGDEGKTAPNVVLLDRSYQTARLYDEDDRTFFVNVRYRP